MPTPADHAEHRAEHTRQDPATAEKHVEIFVHVGLTATDPYKGSVD